MRIKRRLNLITTVFAHTYNFGLRPVFLGELSAALFSIHHIIGRRGPLLQKQRAMLLELSKKFYCHNEPERINMVRLMLFPLTSANSEPIRYLPSGISRRTAYNKYVADWKEPKENTMEIPEPDEIVSKELVYYRFTRVWRKHYPNLKLLHGETDFCDTCVSQKWDIGRATGDLKLQKINALQKHRDQAKPEYSFYTEIQNEVRNNPGGGTIHIVIDFAKKVLLSSMQEQPGNLHFVTGLKFDTFGISCCIIGKTFLFGFPEGYWKGSKSADDVLSVLFYSLKYMLSLNITIGAKRLVIHADNCGGQNKNRFVFWFCSFLTEIGMFLEVKMYFLVAGHRKNIVDGTFGIMKKFFRVRNVYTPQDMMEVLADCASNTIPVLSVDVEWTDWKALLSGYYKIPTDLKVAQNHVFRFVYSDKGAVYVSKYTDSTAEKRFCIWQKDVQRKYILEAEFVLLRKEKASVWKPLKEMPSVKQGNRATYLQKYILDRYFHDDTEFRCTFFGSGAT